MPAVIPDFWLQLPVARSFAINERFNAPRPYANGKHEGLDFAAIDASGNPVNVLAAQSGIVTKVGNQSGGYGNYIRINHDWFGDTWVTWYAHLSAVHVQEGQYINIGQVIGVAGTTGFSTGIHLHLTVQYIGHGFRGYSVDDVVDPEPFVRTGPIPFLEKLSLDSDVTVRDGSLMQPGQQFTKTWRIRNTGTAAWNGGYKLVFDGAERFGAPDSVPLPVAQPGQLVDVSIPMTAPTAEGEYRSLWVASSGNGRLFGSTIDAVITVGKPPPPVAVNEASFVADVTIDDGTAIPAGQEFVKTWRIRNTGNTTWKEGYTFRHVRDRRMDATPSIPLPPAAPGEIIDISVKLKAPSTPGKYRSTWQPFIPEGRAFNHEMYAEIQVVRALDKRPARLDEARFLADVTIPDGTKLKPGQKFTKTWRVRNSGNTLWGPGYSLAFFDDERMSGPDSVQIARTGPGGVAVVSVNLVAPQQAGTYRSTWKFRNPQGNFFEFEMFTLIEVVAENR